jgi:SOS response regulatory protein OraA/RecX
VTEGAPRGALADALTLLGRRDFTEGALRERLLKRGHDETGIDEAVVRCIEYGYIDDRAWGKRRAEELFRRRPMGRAGFLDDLRRHGIPSTMAEEVADDAYAEYGGERAVLADALQRWVDRSGPPAEWRSIRQCSGHLQRRGFASGDVHAALSPWLDALSTRG